MGGALKGQEQIWVITGYRRGRNMDIRVDPRKIKGPLFFKEAGK